MKTLPLVLLASSLVCSMNPLKAQAAEADWSDVHVIAPEGRANIFELAPDEWQASQDRGKIHTISYPVTVTGVLIPKELLVKVMVQPYDNLVWKALLAAFRGIAGFRSFDDLEKFVGLNPIADDDHNLYKIPRPDTQNFANRYGTSFIETEHGTGITFSCATCHVSQLFGVPIYGLQNRFPRANEFFIASKKALSLVPAHVAALSVGAGIDAGIMLQNSKDSMGRIEARRPDADGLDTSLAHVALSLSHRSRDDYANFSTFYEHFPRAEPLRDTPADSKPGTWWNLKYKNKWLLDGSVQSGNPIFTNIMWNEIGRGTDLHKLERWLDENKQTIDDLTAAVFAAEPPKYTDFFRADSIDLKKAKNGQALFASNCSRCHGSYDKAWDASNAAGLSADDLIKTTKVRYFANTPVINVGTDPSRRLGMRSLEQLNDLAISQKHGIVVKAQNGYVPPPLVGIWARWPYFHNNSAPSLCAVLTRADDRPKIYVAGEAVNQTTDFDAYCNGYPSIEKAPVEWKKNPRRLYDTSREGMHNTGHDEGVFLKAGKEMYSPDQKKDIIEFLKTL
ncbi:MAG: hypothetical protein H7249_05185 [Chitinophagaceae bacterium]|nr:hypothetical protein [Oligoflexus sp.]